MSMGGGTTTGTASPWGPAQPYLQGALAGAGNAFASQGPYPSLSPTTQGALDLTANRALTGSPLVQTAQNSVQKMAGGGQTNPYLDSMFKSAADQTRDYTNGAFTAAGRGGSGANQQLLTRNIGELANNFYGGQYNNDQNRMLAASQLAPGLANQDYTDLGALLGTGQAQDQWNLNSYNQPWANLNNYAGAVGNIAGRGGSSTSTAPSQSIVPSLLGSAISSGGNNSGLLGGFGDMLGSFPGMSNGDMGSGLLGTLFNTGGSSSGIGDFFSSLAGAFG